MISLVFIKKGEKTSLKKKYRPISLINMTTKSYFLFRKKAKKILKDVMNEIQPAYI